MSQLHSSILALVFAAGTVASATAQTPALPQQPIDPPGRVGRVSGLTGTVSLKPVGTKDWLVASMNYPLSSGDAIWSSDSSRAEVHIGSSAIHLGPLTAVAFDTIDDHVTRIHVSQGSATVHVYLVDRDDTYLISTPAGVTSLREEGHYRIDVTPDGSRSTVTVRDGEADLMVGSAPYRVSAGESTTLTGINRTPVAHGPLVAKDAWEKWADSLNALEDNSTATRYVSRDMVGYEDLDQGGSWDVDPSYGPAWHPHIVPAGWSPYRFGRWDAVQPWGWTWIADEPWGFATSHYGRWTQRRGQWIWLPGAMRYQPVYAPAVVTFATNPNWNINQALGPGIVAWVPLGPGEPYVPSYRVSVAYLRNINYNYFNVVGFNFGGWNPSLYHYSNYGFPGAMIFVSRTTFVSSQPIGRNAATVRPGDVSGTHGSPRPVAGDTPIEASRVLRQRTADAGPARPPWGSQSTAPRQPPGNAIPAPSGARSATGLLSSPRAQTPAQDRAFPSSSPAPVRSRSTPPPETMVRNSPTPQPPPQRSVPSYNGNSGNGGSVQPDYPRPLTRQRPETQAPPPQVNQRPTTPQSYSPRSVPQQPPTSTGQPPQPVRPTPPPQSGAGGAPVRQRPPAGGGRL